ncbi:hypothetical protein Rhe02_58350 [Rhizocola hellebori]|uniref:Uncharacterized protein n=2 Tax=Rhizocola hellebori TaxID=1392758 RepID=A0A8J3VJ91_9ACTN|nr:hypothetical protein Rhe02_58350 [Rhizocola hellebori]
MTGGGWLLGLALVISTVAPMLNLEWETGDAIWKAGLFASGLGLTAVLSAFAWRCGVGGVGSIIMALAVAVGLVDWLVVKAPAMTVLALALACVGLPLQARAIARATGLIGPAATLGAAAIAAAGIAFTSRLAYQTGAGGESAEIALNIATLIGLLVAAMCAGMAVNSRPMSGSYSAATAAPPSPSPAGPASNSPAPQSPSHAGPASDSPTASVPSAVTATLSRADDAMPAPAFAEPLSRYQRMTLAFALLGTILAALISVAGSLLTTSLAS